MKKRDEFNKLIRQCKRGKVDMIIVKSISRFARNTLDCLKITRMLRELKVDVYFEEQNLRSIDPSSEFYISIYGSVPKRIREYQPQCDMGKSPKRQGGKCVLRL